MEGNGPHVLGNGPYVLGNGPHVLGNGLICALNSQNRVMIIMGRLG